MTEVPTPGSATGGVVGRLGAMIADASHIVVVTGAGISTASGIPDFRGPQGVWKTRRPVFYEDFMRSEDARRDYWGQKLLDRDGIDSAQPNATHHAIVDLERAGKIEMVLTQNIDGLHSVAGTSPGLLVELHGTARLVECQTCGERTSPEAHFESFRLTGQPPVCQCGGFLKSATISFGQSLRSVDLTRARIAAANADLVIALGTSLSVYPAAELPLAAASAGATYVIVNQGPTDHDGNPLVSLRIDDDVTTVVPAAVAAALA